MSSTFIEIKKNTDLKHFKNRLNHNLRKSNLTSGNCKDKDFLNLNLIDNRKNIKTFLEKDKKEIPNGMTRTEISKKISKLNQNLKKSKKEKTKIKIQNEINELKELREKTEKISTAPQKQNFYEIVLTITDIKSDLKRNKEYSKDLSKINYEYIKKILPNAATIGLSTHLDQSNPHTHINLMYYGDNNITNDLNNSFGNIPKHYSKLQKDYNEFVKNHSLLKKYNLDLDNVVKGGKKDYKELQQYKLLQKRINQRKIKDDRKLFEILENNYSRFNMDFDKTLKEIKEYLEQYKDIKNFEYTKHYKDLLELDINKPNLDKLRENYKQLKKRFENENNENLKKEIETLKKDNFELNEDNEILNTKLETINNTVKEKFELTENEFNEKLDKKNQEIKKLNETMEEKEKEVKNLKKQMNNKDFLKQQLEKLNQKDLTDIGR